VYPWLIIFIKTNLTMHYRHRWFLIIGSASS